MKRNLRHGICLNLSVSKDICCCLKIYYKKFLNFFFKKLYLVVVLVFERYADLKIFFSGRGNKKWLFLNRKYRNVFLTTLCLYYSIHFQIAAWRKKKIIMPVFFFDNTLVVLFLSILRMLRDGSLMSCILKEPLPERERY